MEDVRRGLGSQAACPADGLPPEIWSEPVAESELHFLILTYLAGALRWFLRLGPAAYVGANLPVQWEPENLRRHVAPDVFVALGAPRGPRRRSFATWVEGTGLDLVFEISSESTADEDLGRKLSVYQDVLGVREYVIFDPRGEAIDPRLRVFRRQGDALAEVSRPDPEQVELETLDLDLLVLGETLRLRDRRSGSILRSHEEAFEALAREEQARHREAEARHREAEARRAAEARLAELEAQLRRLQGGAE